MTTFIVTAIAALLSGTLGYLMGHSRGFRDAWDWYEALTGEQMTLDDYAEYTRTHGKR